MRRILNHSIIICLYIFFVSCIESKTDTTPIIKLYPSPARSTISLTDKLPELISITKILSIAKDTLLIIDGKNLFVYLVDDSFNPIEKISLKNHDYSFMGGIKDAIKIRNYLYIVDKSLEFKRYNFISRELEIIKRELNLFPHQISNIESVNDSTFIVSSMVVDYSTKEDSVYNNDSRKKSLKVLEEDNKFRLGALYSYKGKLKEKFDVMTSDFDHQYPSFDVSFVTQARGNLYFSFKSARSLLKYDLNNNLLKNSTVEVDQKLWIKPHWEKISGREVFASFSHTRTPLVKYIDDLYYLKFSKKYLEIIKLDIDLAKKANYLLQGITSSSWYKFIIVNGRIILWEEGDTRLYFFDIK